MSKAYVSLHLALSLSALLTACSVYDPEKLDHLGGDSQVHGGLVDESGGNEVAGSAGVEDGTAPVIHSDASVEDSDVAGGHENPLVTDGSSVVADGGEPPGRDCEPGTDLSCPWICPEVCDNQDNNCDGDIDEGDLWTSKGQPCSAGVGECEATGQYVCDENAPEGPVVCDAIPKDSTAELCDNRDNDCDGQIDEEFTDGDGDGVADCLEEDDDDDGVVNAEDNCPLDANPGQEDWEGDGAGDVCDDDDDDDSDPDTSDCAPLDPATYNGATETCDGVDNDCDNETDEDCWILFDYTPSNFDPNALDPASAPDVILDCAATYDSSNPSGFSDWCGQPAPIMVVDTAPVLDVVIVTLQSFAITSTGSLTISGDKPVILAVYGDVTIDGQIMANADGAQPGPGGNASGHCSSGTGDDGDSFQFGSDGSGAAGGGGGFGLPGAQGGCSYGGLFTCNDTPGGNGGSAEGTADLKPLRGGCAGGEGGVDGSSPGGGGPGGGGGGAVQISAAGSLLVSGIISAAGGGGSTHDVQRSHGGGGGGSGGAVLLEGNTATIASGAWVTANGGGGGAGAYDCCACSNGHGYNGNPDSGVRANGGSGCNNSGDGGSGGASQGPAQTGVDGYYEGGGGGGGGVGRIRFNSHGVCTNQGSFSPDFSGTCSS